MRVGLTSRIVARSRWRSVATKALVIDARTGHSVRSMTSGLPVLVIVTGAPGSGKTTLSRELSARLRVPCLARDDIRTGLFFTAGGWTDTPERLPSVDESIDAFSERRSTCFRWA